MNIIHSTTSTATHHRQCLFSGLRLSAAACCHGKFPSLKSGSTVRFHPVRHHQVPGIQVCSVFHARNITHHRHPLPTHPEVAYSQQKTYIIRGLGCLGIEGEREMQVCRQKNVTIPETFLSQAKKVLEAFPKPKVSGCQECFKVNRLPVNNQVGH